MSREESQRLEQELRELGERFPYPPTPNLAQRELHRAIRESRWQVWRVRVVWATAISAIALVLLVVTIPAARAAALSWLRIGAITIYPAEAEPAPVATSDVTADVTALPTHPVVIPPLDSPPGLRLTELAGEIDPATAELATGMVWMLPGYPPDLGMPDRVFVQDFIGPTLISAWVDPDDPDLARLSLFQFSEGAAAKKLQTGIVAETVVGGQPAVWLEGPHMLVTQTGETVFERLVMGRVLIWTADGYTFRLETTQTLDEAIRTAESLRPVGGESGR